MILLYTEGDRVIGYHPYPDSLTAEQCSCGVLYHEKYPQVTSGDVVRLINGELIVEHQEQFRFNIDPVSDLILTLMEQITDLSIQVAQLKGETA